MRSCSAPVQTAPCLSALLDALANDQPPLAIAFGFEEFDGHVVHRPAAGSRRKGAVRRRRSASVVPRPPRPSQSEGESVGSEVLRVAGEGRRHAAAVRAAAALAWLFWKRQRRLLVSLALSAPPIAFLSKRLRRRRWPVDHRRCVQWSCCRCAKLHTAADWARRASDKR
jgi:hypothetical protein